MFSWERQALIAEISIISEDYNEKSVFVGKLHLKSLYSIRQCVKILIWRSEEAAFSEVYLLFLTDYFLLLFALSSYCPLNTGIISTGLVTTGCT